MNTYPTFPTYLRRNLAALWLARGLSTMGNWVVFIALLAWTYRATESARTVAIVVIAWMVMTVLLRPVAASLVNHVNARFVGPAAQSLRAAALLPLLGVGPNDQLQTVQVVALLTMAPAAFFHASHTALLASMVDPDRLTSLKGRLLNTRLLAMIAGSVAGAFVFRDTELRGAVVVGAVALLMSAVLILIARPDLKSAPPHGPKHSPAPSLAGSWRGLLHSLRSPATQGTAIVLMALALLAGGMVVAEVAYTTWGLFVPNHNIGFILAAQGAGLLAALLVHSRARARLRASAIVTAGLVVMAISEFGFILATEIPPVVAFSVVVGLGKGLAMLGLATALREGGAGVDMAGGLRLAAGLGVLLSALLVGGIVETVSPRLAIAMVSATITVLALYAFGAIEDPDTGEKVEVSQVADTSFGSLLPD